MAWTTSTAAVIDARAGLDALVRVLAGDGYRVLGPFVRDGVIEYGDITCGDDLPTGVSVEQSAGRWRLTVGDDGTRFGWTPGADSWKRFVFPARQEVLRIRRTDGSFVVTPPGPPDRPLALIGARDCELRALGVLDRVLLDPDHPDPRYGRRRSGTFVVAVTCGVPSATCWCTSMGGGPRPEAEFDLRLTELADSAGHRVLADAGGPRVLAEAGSELGASVLARLPAVPATVADHVAADDVVAGAVARMPVRLPGAELPALLTGTDDDPHWDTVAARCLSCGNCTSVCPTCFCSTLEDSTALAPDGSTDVETVREQQWASCFQLDHSYLGGRPVRSTTAARYRQWLSHKLQTWTEQFGTAGCVGCGRCTTWCPAGIDIVEEAAVLIGARSGGHRG